MTFAIDYLAPSKGPGLGLSIAVEDITRAWLKHSKQRPFIAHTINATHGEAFLKFAQSNNVDIEKECFVIAGDNPAQSLAPLSCLFVPDPALAAPAWKRALLPAQGPALCGLVHTMSGDQVARAFWDTLLSPAGAGDALICPSLAIREVVRTTFDKQLDYLATRFGRRPACDIQLPVIPLGIDVGKFESLATPDRRSEQRAALGVDNDEIVVLFVGRLNFLTKAHPLPLLLAMQQAARQTRKKLRLVLYGYFFPQAEMQPRFEKLVASYAKDFACEIVTNNDPRFPNGLWAAADIFTSLVDNAQESFGLTPVEAMACGLPSVLTDWDGYRDAVRNGLEGFLVPTTTPPAAAGVEIAQTFAHDAHYGNYLCGALQSTSLDIAAAAQAFAALASDAELRTAMGQRAKARAASYDWSAIIPRYEDLWTQLAQNRQNAAPVQPLQSTPFHLNPFEVFASFPSSILSPDDRLSASGSLEDMQAICDHDMNLFAPAYLLPLPLVAQLWEAIAAQGPLPVSALLSVAPESERGRIWRTLGWLMKNGLCQRLS